MLDFLPDNIKNGLRYVNQQNVYELRLRADKPVKINYEGNYAYLGEYGLTENPQKAIRCTSEDIAECIFQAGNRSVYSVEEQIKQGFITAENGERIGIAGEYVYERGQPLTIRRYTSVCIRVPHEIVGCAAEVYQCCMSDKVKSVLIMSSPGLGKTTILRDLGRILSEKTNKNILVCDERGEISALAVGNGCDVLKYADKATAFEAGIRAMRPDIIITDELSLRDCSAISQAVVAGITVVASAHFSDFTYVETPFLKTFERFVLLDERQIGKIRAIYDKDGRVVYG